MHPEENQPSFFAKHKFTLISLFIILLAAIPLLLLSNSASKKQAPNMHEATSNPSPTTAPLTTNNVQPTLTQADNTMQTTLNQMDTDLKAAASVDTSQDSTSGL